jgi:hypothetical protein
MAAFGGNESCPNCSASMAPDQRYCLNCGHRRGDPRLPFMDAVVFMESQGNTGGAGGATPPPPPAQSGGSSKSNGNVVLIAVVAVLVLTLGVGFLIGRIGHDNGSNGGGEVKVVQIGGGSPTGTEETGTIEPTEEAETGGETGKEAKPGKGGKSGGKPAKKEASEVKPESSEELERAEAAQNEILHAKGKQAKPGTQVGEKCEKGTPGCGESEEFDGEFFE